MRAVLIAVCAACLAAFAPAAFADNLVAVNQAIAAAIANGGNVSTIEQIGSNNYAETDQLGSQNDAAIGQFGNGNSLIIMQNSVGAVAIDNQYGNGNHLTITQTGPHPQPVIITQRR